MTDKITAIVPTGIDETKSLATTFAKSSLIPQDLKGKEADVFVTIAAGMELGLPPMASLRSIHVVKGKPILSADGMVAVARASGACEYFRAVDSTDQQATYETKRKGDPEPQRFTFTMQDAKRAGLTGGNWAKYPKQMLKARAKSILARDVFGDALVGVYTDDEADDFRDPPAQTAPQPAPVQGFEAPPIDAEIVEEASTPEDAVNAILGCTTTAELNALMPMLSKLPEGEGRDKVRQFFAEHRETLRAAELKATAEEAA